eukprot:g1109.t1
MKFCFFSQRKKPSSLKDVAKEKMSKFCCLHTPTNGGDNVIQTEAMTDNEYTPNATSKLNQITNKSVVTQPLRWSPSSPSQGSTISSISPLEAIVSDPQGTGSTQQNKLLSEFCCDQFGLNGSPNVPKMMVMDSSYWRDRGHLLGTSSVCSYSPSHGSSSGRSSRKGPGQGSISDSPPSRMLMESSAPNMSMLKPPNKDSTKRGEVTGATAPDLPTRLEVCGSTRGEKHRLTDSVVSVHSERLDSHPLMESASLNGSLSSSEIARRASGEKMIYVNKYNGGKEVKTSSERGLSNLIASQNRDAVELNSKVLSPEQPTKLMAEADWAFQQLLLKKVNESTKGETETRQEQPTEDTTMRKLHQWNVYLKLNWASDCSDNLVAEVYPIEESSSSSSLSYNFFKNAPHLLSNINAQLKGQLCGIQASTSEKLGSVEAEISLMVNRVLSEINEQSRIKIHSRFNNKGVHKLNDAKTVEVIDDTKPELNFMTKHKNRTELIELETRSLDSSNWFQRRLEILNAFKSTITEMDDKMHTPGGVLWSNCASEFDLLGKIEESGEVSLDMKLSAAILNDLREEIMRLTDRLCILNMAQEESFGEAPLTQLPSEPRTHMHTASLRSKIIILLMFILTCFLVDPESAAGFLERSNSNGERRPHSALAITNERMTNASYCQGQGIVHRSVPSGYPLIPTTEQLHFAKHRTSVRDGVERISEMTLLEEEAN